MTKQYIFGMLAFCFLIWAVVVDNAILPKKNRLKQDAAVFNRYTISKKTKIGNTGFIKDELLVFANFRNRVNVYYMDYTPAANRALDFLEPGTAVQMRYVNRFPKIWRRHLYEIRTQGIPLVGYSARQVEERQLEVWKFTGIMGVVFIVLFLAGLIKKPKKK